MKILFVASAFTREEAFGAVCAAFERQGHTITYYPIYAKINENAEEIIKGNPKPTEASARETAMKWIYDEVILLSTRHDMVLFWKAEALHPKIIHACGQFARTVYYSWDDPYQLEVDSKAISRATMCHVAASCCETTAAKYQAGGCQKGVWIPPGFDPANHHEVNPISQAEVDVSFIATNTYCKEIYGANCFDRRDLIKETLKVTKKLELWGQGDQPLGWLHPVHGLPELKEYYKGFIKFENAKAAFSSAKVCVNSHVRRTGKKYFNERTFQIMGCKRPMLIDQNAGSREVLGDTVYYYDTLDEYRSQLRWILENPNEAANKAEAAYQLAMKLFTWDKFCERIVEAAQ